MNAVGGAPTSGPWSGGGPPERLCAPEACNVWATMRKRLNAFEVSQDAGVRILTFLDGIVERMLKTSVVTIEHEAIENTMRRAP